MNGNRQWFACLAVAGLGACANDGTAVVAATATVIGVEIGSNATTGAPSGTLGYRRGEYAYVPTKKGDGNRQSGSLKDVPDVIMELSYGGVFTQDGRIYQRLAVGSTAVTQARESGMFLRNAEGQIDAATLALASRQAGLTMASTADVVACVSKDGKVDAAALKKIVDRAVADGAVQAAVSGYQAALLPPATQPPLSVKQLQGILAQSDALAAALGRHVSQADCMA